MGAALEPATCWIVVILPECFVYFYLSSLMVFTQPITLVLRLSLSHKVDHIAYLHLHFCRSLELGYCLAVVENITLFINTHIVLLGRVECGDYGRNFASHSSAFRGALMAVATRFRVPKQDP